MPHPRRQFLRNGLGLGALLALGGAGRAAEALTPASGTPPRGLLFDAEDLPRIRANVLRPEFSEFWKYMTSVDFAADEKFLREELRLTNHIVHMLRAQSIALRSAFVHVLTPDPKHLALARLALARLFDYPRWDWLLDSQQRHVGIMRGAGTCIALALIAEWLATDLTPEEQAAITRGMSTEGGPSQYRGLHDMTHHDTAGPWSVNQDEEGLPPMDVTRWPRILDDTNLRIICTAGMAAATAHLQGRNPEEAQWLEMTRLSLRLYAERLPKDASFPEGVGYWDYTFSHYIFALEVLRRKFGFDDCALVNFPGQARFALEMTMPTAGHPDDCISIGDSLNSAGSVPLSWIAREYRDPVAQYLLRQPGAVRATWYTIWATIWYDPTVEAHLPAEARLDHRQELGIVVSRTGWTEKDAVVSLRSGGPVNHEHADRNSVIFTAYGERLLNDHVRAAYSTKEPKWLLRQTEAHTSILIDGQGHIYHDGRDGTNSSPATATIQEYRTGPGWMIVTSDAAGAYRRAGLPASLVQRTLVYLKPGVLAIFDRVMLTESRPVQARFQIFNEDGAGRISVDGGTFAITRPHATLRASVTTAAECTLTTGKLALPEASGVYPFAEIRSAAALEHSLLTVCTAAPQGGEHGNFRVTSDADAWEITGTHRGQKVLVRMIAAGKGAPVIVL